MCNPNEKIQNQNDAQKREIRPTKETKKLTKHIEHVKSMSILIEPTNL
jgi:hypothetical protein